MPDSPQDEQPALELTQKCLWLDCTHAFPDPESLYNHLCNEHIGRKSTNNLCLTCKWKDCGTSCAKRDHITSHLRVHTPLKPHVCEICKKSFKRPQDLKKHEKIHTEEHHAQHKHSKAITVADPAYVSRVRGDSSARPTKPAPSKSPSNGSSAPRAQSRGSSASDGSYPNYPPTPSPDFSPPPMNHHSPTEENYPNSWDPSTGSKRSHEYSVDDFFTDMKKRRLSPSYDPRMAERLERLNHMSYSLHQAAGFNPRSVSLDIRTPEELAAVNDFLITLGRDVSDGPRPHSGSTGFSSNDSFFDPVSLSQLGLANMPGVPGAGHSPYPPQFTAPPYSSARSTHPSVQPGLYGSVYPHLEEHPIGYHGEYPTRRAGNKYAPYPPHYHAGHHPSPPHDGGSPHSASSHSTPPQLTLPPADNAAFNFPRQSRGPPQVAQLSPAEFLTQKRHTMIPLGSAGPAEPIEPKLPTAPYRGPPAKLTSTPTLSSSESLAKGGSLYPLLTKGDAQYDLPPLRHQYRSPSPSSRASTPPTSVQGSPPSKPAEITVLPPLRTITAAATLAAARSEDDADVAHEMERIQLGDDERRRHAELIRDLLISINAEFRRTYGTPAPPIEPAPTAIVRNRDVEMTAA
ncbi:hypothetical protein C8F01DRAFT_1107959 [Mycena amicta]|nr:hypothetical protein C8F01DRAFT_1107959 [Mycena amicta]